LVKPGLVGEVMRYLDLALPSVDDARIRLGQLQVTGK
jgi:hypothetical protein